MTTLQELTNQTFVDVTGSLINYKPPSGTKQVIYKFTLAVSGDGNNNINNAMRPMASVKLFIDNDSGNYEECSAMRYFSGTMTSHGDFRTITAVLNVSSSTNIAAGEINWNELRKIKVQCNEWNKLKSLIQMSQKYQFLS